MKIDVSIIYVYFNTPNELLDSIKTLKSAAHGVTYEIIIVDNASELKLQMPDNSILDKNIIVVKNKKNVGYGAGHNIGAMRARGKTLLLSNPDVLYSPGSITKMFKRIASDRAVGILGPQILNSKNEVSRSLSGSPLFPNGLFAFSELNKLLPNNKYSKNYFLPNLNLNKEHSVSTIGGACMMVKSEIFQRINGFDERFFLFFEENDICLRIKKLGLSVLYFPAAKVLHAGSKSMSSKTFIQSKFEESRFKFFTKYHGLVAAICMEIFMRICTKNNIALILILLLSTFANFYRINELVLFIGDSGRDYLAARDMIVTHTLPLVGIPSSVTWLHQGPLSIYLIGIAFIIGNFSPYAPAILYAAIGVATVYLVYKLGLKIFNNSNIALLSSLFYATSPLFIVNARMPYHTSSIPFFAGLFFLALLNVEREKKYMLFLVFLLFGLLLQVELSNAVFLVPLACMLFIKKVTFSKRNITYSLCGLVVGVLPFILYDITHKFVYSVGFPLWTINRVRLFFGVATSSPTSPHAQDAIFRIYQQLASAIFPISKYSAVLFILFTVYGFCNSIFKYAKNRRIDNFFILILWLGFPLLAFIIHSTPGTAYFPALYPAIALCVGSTAYLLNRKVKYFSFVFILGCLSSVFIIIQGNYFIPTMSSYKTLPPFNYYLGTSLEVTEDVSTFIVNDAKGRAFKIEPGGFIKKYPTSVDTYKYVTWFYGGKQNSNSRLTYIIHQEIREIPQNERIIYKNKYIFVTTK